MADAIREAHDAGIRTVMITGDHIDTAVAIAKQLGIVADRSQAITGADLDRMSDEELDAHIEDYGVYARVQPEHKTRIVEAWKSRDQIVAMTGDGVNDAPAVKSADIGVAMGITGTEVTKEAATMILADDNYGTIVSAVEQTVARGEARADVPKAEEAETTVSAEQTVVARAADSVRDREEAVALQMLYSLRS